MICERTTAALLLLLVLAPELHGFQAPAGENGQSVLTRRVLIMNEVNPS